MKYRTVVFIQGEESDKPFDILHEDGVEALFEYLLQWEYGEAGELFDTKPWGTWDEVEYLAQGETEYAVSWNWNLAYVSLTEIISE